MFIKQHKYAKTSIRMVHKDCQGLSLAELMVAAVLLIIIFAAILLSYIKCLELNELSKNLALSLKSSRSRLETIKNTDFNQIKATYNNITFVPSGLNGIGVTYVDDTDPSLLKITVTVGWRQANSRVAGEDTNQNGQLDGGEDKNANGLLDSPTTLVSYIFEG